MSFFHVLPLLILTMAIPSSSDDGADASDEVIGLIAFKSELHDPLLSLASWNEDDQSPCSWRFVECNPISGRVVQLSLDGLSLSGKIGIGLQKLPELKVLSLSNNNFSGSIGTHLDLLSNIERLNLSRNRFSSSFPQSILNSSSIKFLDAAENDLSGTLPDDAFGNCSSLRYLSFAGNSLCGHLPRFDSCVSLKTLNLSNNYFSGETRFSSGLWSLSRLRRLDLSHNFLHGIVPGGISYLRRLKELRLRRNWFSGSIPEDLGLCLHLEVLDMSENQFDGNLPSSLSKLTSMVYLSFSGNKLADDFPSWIGQVSYLQHLDLSKNGFSATLPDTLGELKSLKFFDCSDNKISGSIPVSLASCSMLKVIRMRSNFLIGIIPERLFNVNLVEVDLADNGLTGFIPPASSGFSSSIRSIDLSRNNLGGQLRHGWIELSSSLRYLNLSWNHLQSTLPEELGYLQNLGVLDLRNNAFNGSIPADLCESSSLEILRLDSNSLTDPIPQEIGNCSSLYILTLSHNNLTGRIPESTSNLSKLKVLKLEFNDLRGDIPREIAFMNNLREVNVSYNKLIGELPDEGIFRTLDVSSLKGNPGLCSPILATPCKMNFPKPLVLDPFKYPNQIGSHRKAKKLHHHMFLSVSAMVAISAAALILIGVFILSVVNASLREKIVLMNPPVHSSSLSIGKLILFDSPASSPEWIANPETLLSEANQIGEGVHGSVYKLYLGSQSREVAIRKLNPAISTCPEDFDLQIRTLGRAKHPNIISIKGYYHSPKMQLLVTQYAANGSLQSKLLEHINGGGSLPWRIRFKIIEGIAKGLAYLHHIYGEPIIHYNMKPSNILLDGDYNPMISDYGLAKLARKVSTGSYTAPELACHNMKVTEKCDVYGFGMCAMEMVTGIRVSNDEARALVEEGNASESVDSTMGECPEYEVIPVLKLSLICLSEQPSSRPSMAEVVHILQLITSSSPDKLQIY